MARAKIVSFINYKGGVGKTTTTYHVGCSLAQHHNKKVLLVDIDPQTNLTFLCAPPERWQEFKKKTGTIATMYQRFQQKKAVDTKRFIWREPVALQKGRIKNLDIIPCDIDLLGEDLGGGQITGSYNTLDVIRKNATQYLRERTFLSQALREVDNDYDYILIDCPPNLYLMTQNALMASNKYFITAIPDHLSTIGLTILQQKVDKIGGLVKAAHTFAEQSKNPASIAGLGGIIFVKVRVGGVMLTITHISIMERVGQDHPGMCFKTFTTELIGYGEAAEGAKPVWEHPTQNAKRAAKKAQYIEIANEFVGRF